MKTASLTKRVLLAVLALELLCACAFSGLALWHEYRSRLRAFDVQVQGRLDSLLGAVQDAEDPEDNVFVDPAELKLPREDVYAVYSETGRLLGKSEVAPPELIANGEPGFRTEHAGRAEYRVLRQRALRIIDREETAGAGLRRPVTLVYASPADHLRHEITEAASFYALLSVALVGATAVLLLLTMRRLLAPLSQLASAAAAVNMSSLSFVAPPDALEVEELRPLVGALAETIGRLRAAIEAQHRFLGDAAHELKTAVAVVRSSLQLLMLRPRSNEEYGEGLQHLLTDNERVEALVASMLTLARFEGRAGSGELFEFTGPVQEATERMASLAELREVSIAKTFCEGVRTRLTPEASDVLASNLLLNAIQHSPKGSEVSIAVRCDAEAKTMLLEVSDHGKGIAAESLPHVFERFYREDASRSRETGGAGLGLAICKSIVDSVGGSIAVESAVGKGTTVSVALRLE